MYNMNMPQTRESLYSFLCTISEQYDTGILIIDVKNTNYPIIFANSTFFNITAYSKKEVLGQNIQFLCGLKTDAEMMQEINYQLTQLHPFDLKILHYKKDRTAFWNNITCQPIKNDLGTVEFAVLYCRDITSHMLNKMLSRLEHEVYTEITKNVETSDIMQLITEKVEKHYIRDIFCSIHLYLPDSKFEAISSGSLPLSMVPFIENKEISIESGYNQNAVYINNLSVDGKETKINGYSFGSSWSKPIINEDKKILGYFTIYTKKYKELKQVDTEFLKRLTPIIALSISYVEQKQELKRLAYYDMNTGIPNYNYFYTNLLQWIENGVEGTLLLIQPSEYSSIVDLFGRRIGDELIYQLVNRLEKLIKNENHIIYGRFSNSSFILGTNFTAAEKLKDFISQIVQTTSTPFAIAEREIYITLKIGVSNFERTITIDESIRRADIALTKSRHQIGAVVSYFEVETDERIQRELEILNQLTYALKNDEFTIHIQPKVNLATSEIEGFEALARWYSPVLGQVSPIEFIPVAEQAGKISEIDKIALEKVLNFQYERNLKGLKLVPIAVNISPVHFYNDSFVEDFIKLVKKYDIEPQYIKIEVTESVELFDHKKAKEILLELKKHGYESSIDDFGVGFSSLSYLQQLPFSEIKIDRSFINNIHDNGMHAVVQTIVQLATNLNMHAVAEGIETLDQYRLLQQMGCRTGQGYYFHKPMPLEEAEKLLNSIK